MQRSCWQTGYNRGHHINSSMSTLVVDKINNDGGAARFNNVIVTVKVTDFKAHGEDQRWSLIWQHAKRNLLSYMPILLLRKKIFLSFIFFIYQSAYDNIYIHTSFLASSPFLILWGYLEIVDAAFLSTEKRDHVSLSKKHM